MSPAPAARPAAWLSCSGLIATTAASGPKASAGSRPEARSGRFSSAADEDALVDEPVAAVSPSSLPPHAVSSIVQVRAAARTPERRRRAGDGMRPKLVAPVRSGTGPTAGTSRSDLVLDGAAAGQPRANVLGEHR